MPQTRLSFAAVMFAVLMVMGCKANVNTGTQSFAVAFSAVGGTVSAKVDGKEITNGALIARGKTVTFTAHPQSGMKVSHWTGIENASDKVTVSLTVNAAVSVTAECTAIMHTVAFTQPEHGTLKATVGGKSIAAGAPVEKGKTVVFIAEAADGYNVDGWTLDGTAVNGTNAVYVLPVTKAVEVKVSFTAASAAVSQFPILFANPEHGTLAAQKADNTNFVSGGEVQKNEKLTFTVMPDTGYEVARWTVTGAAVAGNTTNTYEHTVSAAAMVNVSLKKRPTKLRLNRTGEHLNRLNRVCYIKIRYFQSERW